MTLENPFLEFKVTAFRRNDHAPTTRATQGTMICRWFTYEEHSAFHSYVRLREGRYGNVWHLDLPDWVLLVLLEIYRTLR